MKKTLFIFSLFFTLTGISQTKKSPVRPEKGMQRPFTSVSIGGIINTYTPVISLTPCVNGLVVEDASTFNTGDTVLLIQMKGAIIDTTNTSAFGTITDNKNAGNYEINYVKSKSGNTIELLNTISRSYDLPGGKVQLVRIPYYQTADITTTLSCLPWDGNKGGVLVLHARDSVIMHAAIDVSGKGFKGGADPVSIPSNFNCYENQYFYPPVPDLASEKGEGIAILSVAKSYGKGHAANAGGGGNSHNSGGGGGANAGTGGFGGYNFEGTPCDAAPFDNRGIGGIANVYSAAANKIFLGGGGGAGHSNNPQAFQSIGGSGSGIIILITDKLVSNGNNIIAGGAPGYYCGSGSAACHEGMGGGGGGGTVLIKLNTIVDPLVVDVSGGKGADMTANGFLKVGPGGGGGGGLVWVSTPTTPANMTVTNAGGIGGVCTGYSNNPWGAVAGQAGYMLNNLSIPFDNILFKPNIDSVRITQARVRCDSFQFNGLAFTNTNAIASWQWYFSDGGTSNTQNTGHQFNSGTHTVKLVVTDINGCKNSIETTVITAALTANAGPDDLICSPNSVVLQGSSTGATQYSWSPATYLNNPSIPNPTATPPVTTTFYLSAINADGCSSTDSVIITVRSPNGFSINPPATVCQNQSFQLSASGGDIYAWQPASTLSDPTIFNPVANPTGTTTYFVSITDIICGNTANLSTTITIRSLPLIRAGKSNDINCIVSSSRLTAVGGTSYSWTPAGTLNNAGISTPTASPVVTTTYQVKGTDAAGCSNTDTVQVKVNYNEKGGYLMPTAFTPNNDGLNDCYGVKLWGNITEIEFSIYNRWGQRIFYSTRADACWDGTFKGELQTPDVYVYTIKAKTTCEPAVFRKGTFALIR
ncbi:MAG: gliding motility-associated C-terminal domain-containing protein [Bacteroidetes bacterium]|nr:gliding motility-associated C-terminal domain-containing protein [Bacteroidota bacterium]